MPEYWCFWSTQGTCEIRGVTVLVRGVVWVSSQQLLNVHRGSVLPEGRFILAVPLAALCFYVLVVRRNRDR